MTSVAALKANPKWLLELLRPDRPRARFRQPDRRFRNDLRRARRARDWNRVHPDGKTVCTARRDKKIHLWKIKDQKKNEEIGGFAQDILRLIIQGEFIFTGSADKLVRQHRLNDQKLVQTFSGHTDWVYALAVHAPSQRLATGSYNGEVLIWNLEDGQLLHSFVAAPGWKAAGNKTR